MSRISKDINSRWVNAPEGGKVELLLRFALPVHGLLREKERKVGSSPEGEKEEKSCCRAERKQIEGARFCGAVQEEKRVHFPCYMVSNVPLLGYIENASGDDDATVELSSGIAHLHLSNGVDDVEEIQEQKAQEDKYKRNVDELAPGPPIRLSFGSAPSLGYIENSTVVDDNVEIPNNKIGSITPFGSATSLGYIENSVIDDSAEIRDSEIDSIATASSFGSAPSLGYIDNSLIDDSADVQLNESRSFSNVSPISLRAISVAVASSPFSNLVDSVHDNPLVDYGEYYGGFESDGDYSYTSVGSLSSLEDNGLTDEDFSNISLFLDEQQASIPFEAIPSAANEVVMTSLGLKLLPMHLSPSLTSLDLSHNELRSITPEIQHLTVLSQLLLWDNLIESVDSSIGLLESLRVLDLNHNSLSHLPIEINQLRNLQQLLLVNNKFTEFPDIFQLHLLQSLHLEMNTIEHIPSEIGQLTSLTELILTNNTIVDVPQELFHLSFLKELRLSHNRISHIPEDLCLRNLEILTLDHNELLSLVPGICQISSLVNLDVSHNRLQELPDLDALAALTSLNLNNNQIDEIPPSIGSLRSLQYLLLYNNNLRSLPSELVSCRQLVDLGLGGNQLPSIYNLGTSAVLSILRDAKNNTKSSPPILHDWEINFHELEFYSVIGEGAFGQVFQGRWRGNDVAIKKLFSASLLEEQTLREFRREVGMLSRLKPHKHLVRYFGACTQPPHLFIITEFIPRGSLHDLLHQSFMEIPPSLKLKFAQGTALGCHYLINNDPPVYHCDLKAKNLLITADWNIKLGDFGQSTFDYATNNNADWTYVRFAAPEIFKKSPHSEKSEVFSFGVILWELITRRIPYQDQEPESIKTFIKNGGRLEIPSDFPPAYKKLLTDCWQEDPSKRPTFMEIYLTLKRMELHQAIR